MMLLLTIFRNKLYSQEDWRELEPDRETDQRNEKHLSDGYGCSKSRDGQVLRRSRKYAMIHITQCVEGDGYGYSKKDNGTS